MKIRTMLLTVALTVGSLTAATTLAHSQDTGTGDKKPAKDGKKDTKSKSINLQCKNPGGQQDVNKTPNIINSTSKKIPAGTTIYWGSDVGDRGSVVLTNALAPGDKIGVTGTPGQSYTCIAWINK